jgi:lysozyme family protein
MAEYTASFDAAVDHTMLYEVGGFWNLNTPGVREGLIATSQQRKACGYVNDPTDMGGETKYGIAKNSNKDLNITNLNWETAKRVYFRRYWLLSHCDQITIFAPRLAVLHFDGAVNHGVGRASTFLQRAAGVTADGDIGPATLSAIQALDEITLCNKVCDIRVDFYKSIVTAKPAQVKFLNGWLRRIEEMRAFTTNPSSSFT